VLRLHSEGVGHRRVGVVRGGDGVQGQVGEQILGPFLRAGKQGVLAGDCAEYYCVHQKMVLRSEK